MSDPFLITGPAVISFSGGRTSAYMLYRILQAHGGGLPENVVVCFANTGREMPATLDFVRDCGAAWNVPIAWAEYRYEGVQNGKRRHGFERVSHNSASRDGRPFQEVVEARKGMLPNPVTRFCTAELKIRTVERLIKAETGWTKWTQIVGLRADEPGRVERSTEPTRQKKQASAGWVICPLAKAGVTVVDVMRFWKQQPFDLRLAGPWEGNCDGCFLKGRGSIARMSADHSERMEWWAKMEAAAVARGAMRNPAMAKFRADREDYATMARTVRDQGVLPMTWLEAALPCTAGGCGI